MDYLYILTIYQNIFWFITETDFVFWMLVGFVCFNIFTFPCLEQLWLCGVMVRTLDSWSEGRGFKSLSGRYQVVTIWMGDCLRTSKPSWYITNHQGQPGWYLIGGSRRFSPSLVSTFPPADLKIYIPTGEAYFPGYWCRGVGLGGLVEEPDMHSWTTLVHNCISAALCLHLFLLYPTE